MHEIAEKNVRGVIHSRSKILLSSVSFCNELACITWKMHNPVGYVNAAWEYQESFLHLCLFVSVNAADQSYFIEDRI